MEDDADISMSQSAELEAVDVSQETPAEEVFVAPSIDRKHILRGDSYTYASAVPAAITNNPDIGCVLGVDEAGRGPVLGPMVYAVYYMPEDSEKALLKDTHHFDDSKALTPTVRSDLMEKICTPGSDLFTQCGWAIRALSARDISAGMMQATGAYNLNQQAMDATVRLIQETFDRGVNVKSIFIDTIGPPQTYQRKLERIFPQAKITVAKKADSLYPCVSAASVCAKVTRDAALEVCAEAYKGAEASAASSWGSGYPSDARCSSWLKQNLNPIFGWGSECRFSWGTAKDLIEGKNAPCNVRWQDAGDDEQSTRMTNFLISAPKQKNKAATRPEIADWFGQPASEEVF